MSFNSIRNLALTAAGTIDLPMLKTEITFKFGQHLVIFSSSMAKALFRFRFLCLLIESQLSSELNFVANSENIHVTYCFEPSLPTPPQGHDHI